MVMIGAVIVSALGMAFHTVREFGWLGLLNPALGMIPVVALQVVLLRAWLRDNRQRGPTKWLLATGLIELVGGGLSVLPLPILPYAPDQSLYHYISHVVWGVAQLPLIWVGARALQHQALSRSVEHESGKTGDPASI